jgi:hypothetical protein
VTDVELTLTQVEDHACTHRDGGYFQLRVNVHGDDSASPTLYKCRNASPASCWHHHDIRLGADHEPHSDTTQGATRTATHRSSGKTKAKAQNSTI